MKLVPAKSFNRPVGKMIQLPYEENAIAAHVTVMILHNGQVELKGMLEPEDGATKLLHLGLERLKRYHAKRREKQKAMLVGPDGNPITSEPGLA